MANVKNQIYIPQNGAKTIMGFDIASSLTGWAVIKNGRVYKKNLGLIKINAKTTMGDRLCAFAKEVESVISKYKPDIVFVEDIYRGKNAQTFKTLAQFRGVAIFVINTHTGKDPFSIMPSQIRKILNIPNDKNKVFDILNKKYKLCFDFKQHNDIVDALAICLAARIAIRDNIDISTNKKRKKRRKNNNGSV